LNIYKPGFFDVKMYAAHAHSTHTAQQEKRKGILSREGVLQSAKVKHRCKTKQENKKRGQLFLDSGAYRPAVKIGAIETSKWSNIHWMLQCFVCARGEESV